MKVCISEDKLHNKLDLWENDMKLKKLLMAGGAAALVSASTAYASIIDRPFFQVLGVVVVWGADGMDGNAPVATDFVLLTPASGSAGADLIGGNAVDGATVVTGSLTPVSSTGANAGGAAANPVTGATSGGVYTDDGNGVLDAADSLTAFGVDANTDIGAGLVNQHRSSFYVASNAAFDIYAQSSNLVSTGDFTALSEADIAYSMAVTVSGNDGLAFGAQAQDPSTGGAGYVNTVNDLGDMATATKVFDGGQRTAANTGSLVDQSVRFDNTYTLQPNGSTSYDLSMGVGTIRADVTYTVYVP